MRQIDRAQRMLPVSREPAQVLGAVVDGVESPQEVHTVLQAMRPVDHQIDQEQHLEQL